MGNVTKIYIKLNLNFTIKFEWSNLFATLVFKTPTSVYLKL